jgi:hypothetical protein
MVHDFAWAADKIIYDVVTGPNDVAIHFLYKIIQLLSKTGKVAMMVKVMDFTIKCWKLSLQTILIHTRW